MTTQREPAATDSVARPLGAQAIARAAAILQIVGAAGDVGARARDVAASADLHIATTRRILQALVAEGLCSRSTNPRAATGLGRRSSHWRSGANHWYSGRGGAVRVLEQIARLTNDTALFSIRSGDESVCLERREGDVPDPVMSFGPGDRRPLGAGSGSNAMLAFLDDPEREAVLRRNRRAYGEYGLSVDDVRAMLNDARRRGYAYNPGRLIAGVHGVALPVLGPHGVEAAVSVAAVESRMGRERRLEVVETIRRCLGSLPGVRLPELDRAA